MNPRQEANFELMEYLWILIEKHEDMRFSQILQNYGFIKPNRPVKDPERIEWQNEFNLESVDLLKRVSKRFEDIEEQE